MSKLAIVAFVSVFVIACQGFPRPQQQDIASAAASGNWDQVHKILEKMYEKMFDFKKIDVLPNGFHDVLKENVEKLKPTKDGKVYGESEVSFISSSVDANGKKHVSSGGHKVINNNGKVQEFDFTPKIKI